MKKIFYLFSFIGCCLSIKSLCMNFERSLWEHKVQFVDQRSSEKKALLGLIITNSTDKPFQYKYNSNFMSKKDVCFPNEPIEHRCNLIMSVRQHCFVLEDGIKIKFDFRNDFNSSDVEVTTHMCNFNTSNTYEQSNLTLKPSKNPYFIAIHVYEGGLELDTVDQL